MTPIELDLVFKAAAVSANALSMNARADQARVAGLRAAADAVRAAPDVDADVLVLIPRVGRVV
jgi:hypothetical protein